MAGRIDKAECRALRAQGRTLDQLAARYGVSRAAVSAACKGVVSVTDHSGVGASALKRFHAQGSAERALHIRRLYAAGLGPKEISFATGLALGTIYRHLPPLASGLARRLRATGGATSEAAACR